MGTAGDSVVNTISNNFGSQTGQFAQQNLQQFATNPNQFAQTFPNQVSNQLGMTFPGDKFCWYQYQKDFYILHFPGSDDTSYPGSNQVFQNGQQFVNNGQQFLQSGQQFVQTGQQLVQGQFPNQFSQFQVIHLSSIDTMMFVTYITERTVPDTVCAA